MSKYIKLALVFIGVGIILFITGSAFGGKGFVVTSDFKVSAIDEYQIFEYKNMDIEELDSIHIDVQNVPVTFRKAEGDKFGVEVRYEVMEKDDLEVSVEDKELTVKAKEKMYWISFDFSFMDKKEHEEEYVIVYIPDFADVQEAFISTSNAQVVMDEPGSKLFHLEINTGNGSVTLDKTFVVSSLEISTSNGKIQINNSVCSLEAELGTSNGNVIINNSELSYMDIDTSNGKVEISDSWFAGDKMGLDADTSNGSIRLNFINHEESQFSIDADTSNGEIYVNDKEVTEDSYTLEKGPINLKLETSNSDIMVNFK